MRTVCGSQCLKYLLAHYRKSVSPCKPSKLELNPLGIDGPKRALCWVNPSFSLMVGLWSSRTNSSERPGNQGPKTEDSWSHGRHAQHNIQCCHQPPEPRFPPLLFQICGDQPLWTRSQCLCLPAPEEMKASSVFRSAIWLSEGVTKERLWQSRLKKKSWYFVGLYMLSFLKRGER